MSRFDGIQVQLKPYSTSNSWSASVQILNTLVPFFLVWTMMILFHEKLGAAVVLLSLLNGLFLVRIFVLQHDCGHYSFFPKKAWNDYCGNFLSIITFTPLYNWRREHNLHHAHIGNLDFVEHGDFKLLTIDQYQQRPAWQRFLYRLYRNPLVLFIIGPVFYLTLRRRFPVNLGPEQKKEKRNVLFTNIFLCLIYIPLFLFLGAKIFFILLLPILFLGSSLCIWGFFVQHTYEGGYWESGASWSFADAAFHGSSYYDLPGWMLWFSADISVHHVHHLNPKIPNYNLQKCLRENPELRPSKSISFLESLSCASLKLWDERNKRFVGFP